MRVAELHSIQIKLASPKDILEWSHGEVLKPETINYRTLKAEKDGLFCERIFGPSKDYQCYCGKYRGIRYKGIVCDRCGVEILPSSVRRERMGHIKLAAPVTHIWFLRGIPSRIGMVLNIPKERLEKVVYFVAYIITWVSEEEKQRLFKEIEKEYQSKVKAVKAEIKNKRELNLKLKELKDAREEAVRDLKEIEPLKIISESKYRDLSLRYGEVFQAKTGAEALYDIFKEIDLYGEVEKIKKGLEKLQPAAKKKALRRLKFFQGMIDAKIRPEWMFLTVLPVLPPDLRPMVQLDGGRYASSDLNDLYRRVINRNNRLKYLLDIAAPEVIVRNEKRMLQEAVDALIDNGMRTGTMTRATTGGRRLLKSLADMLKGKKGRFRRNLLGKRVDYSGRAVIVVGPELKLDRVGLPKEMALEIFKPFVIKKLLEKELAYNVRGASRLIEEETAEVWAALEEVVKDKFVLLNRAPTLHRISVQAFRPVLTEGKAIRIPSMVCSAYNADFDGDQMAVHLPLSEESQSEARDIMLSRKNLLKPANGKPIVTPTQDVILGCYWLSKIKEGAKGEGRFFSSQEEAILASELGEIDIRAKIKVLLPGAKLGENKDQVLVETSVGRLIFNNILPEDFPFQNELLNSKKLNDISWQVIERYGNEKAADVLDKMKNLGFEYSTRSGISIGINDFEVPEQKKVIVAEAEKRIEEVNNLYKRGLLSDEEKSEKVIEIWTEAKTRIEKILPQTLLQEGPIFIIADSGCRGSWVQPVQIAGMRGLMVNPSGDIIELPVKNSFKEGLEVLEYFISTHGARKGTSDTALGTSKAGYLTRRLIDVAHDVIVIEKDCGDKKGIKVSLRETRIIGQDPGLKLAGRVSLEQIKNKEGKVIVKKGEIIDWEAAKEIEKTGLEELRVRSPLSCQTMGGVCQLCYGWDMGRNELVELGAAVGIVAAQSIGEPGTQLTMRTFHTGGVAGDVDITMGLPRVEEVFERRPPKGEAAISDVEGEVVNIKRGLVKVRLATTKRKGDPEIVEYRLPENLAVWVEKGQRVTKGQQLCEGNIDLRKLYRLVGKEITQNYIVQEIQKIYTSQGVKLHDKHVEVIVRQMFSRFKIVKSGDSRFLPGEIIEKDKFLKENERLNKANKQPATAKEVLLGISRVALTSDSFLSAASFQQTSKILIKAAVEGKEDELRGLKENVIIGKLIPVGTGFRKS
jgi:DNA-directed RNA polymerase subunit beta'